MLCLVFIYLKKVNQLQVFFPNSLTQICPFEFTCSVFELSMYCPLDPIRTLLLGSVEACSGEVVFEGF